MSSEAVNVPKPVRVVSPVRIWEQTVGLPTYPAPPPDPNPMFFENRMNQGASGRIYPNPLTDRVNDQTKVDQAYQAVFIENEYLQLMVLPELGGRIHAALDKTNGYDFIYRQQVVKPVLIGLFGSWLSGGMEFNWPLHHRPSTFMPVEYFIEESADGSATLWLSEHEPMNRMKGMVGICLYPDKALFELKVQLYNRTALPQPFLWWVNCAVHVNEQYQVIFPPDVEDVAYHSRVAMTTYPVARQVYAGADWRTGVDLSWPGRNVVQATSYFANPSQFDFFGGYDHGQQAGIIHVANRHVAPGKKCFAWGTGEHGMAWQASLTDGDGPYIELMAGGYSDNQPDFSWLQPYETKIFSQYWFPIQRIGGVKNATARLAVNLDDGFVGVCATEVIPEARITITSGERPLLDSRADLAPGKPFLSHDRALKGAAAALATLRVSDARGNELIRFQPPLRRDQPLPPTAAPPKSPSAIDSLEELYLTGLHVEQYLHPTLDPAAYWQQALQRDPGDSRSANALGRLLLRRGDFVRAEALLRRAIQTLTRYNFNPGDGEPHYNLGLALAYQGRYGPAYEAFYKAIWSYAWQAPGYYALAQIDCRRGDFQRALTHLDGALTANARHNQARNLKAAALRHLGQPLAAAELARENLQLDPLDHWAGQELVLAQQALDQPAEGPRERLAHMLRGPAQNHLDLAFDYAGAGLYREAADVLRRVVTQGGTYPMVYYALAHFAGQLNQAAEAEDWDRLAAAQKPDWCFPSRLEELLILQAARAANPADARAAYYLGNLLYDKKQYAPAIEAWAAAAGLEPDFAIPWRNLGIAYFNHLHDAQAARASYERARAANPTDPRLLLEYDQLLKRIGVGPAERLPVLQQHADLVAQRDDLSLEYASLYNHCGQPEKALQVLVGHRFHAWEGGEGVAADQYMRAHLLLGQAAMEHGNPPAALAHYEQSRRRPASLGVGRVARLMDGQVGFYAALAHEALGQAEAAQDHWRGILAAEAVESLTQPFSALTYYAALALRKLGDEAGGRAKLHGLLDHAAQLLARDGDAAVPADRRATTVFADDPKTETRTLATYLTGLANQGLGHLAEARKAFESVLSLAPNHREAQVRLQELQ